MELVDATAEFDALNKAFGDDFNNGDPEAIANRYTADAKLMPPNSGIIEGKENIAAFWQGVMDAGVAKVELYSTDSNTYGDIALDIGGAKLYTADGALIDEVKFIVNYKKVDGKWMMHQDIWNSSTTLPAPAEEEGTTEEENSSDSE